MLADIVVVAVVALFIAAGAKMGLMRSLLSMGSYVLSIILSVLLYPAVSGFLLRTPLYTYLEQNISKNFASELLDGVNTGLMNFFEVINIDVDGAVVNLSAGIAGVLINVISFILVLVLSRVGLGIVIRTVDLIAKLPVIKQFNRIGGAVFGGFKGILLLYIVFALVVLFVPFKRDNAVLSRIEESSFAKSMYEENVILNMIEKGSGG